MSGHRITVAGGGIGGMTAATALARAGFTVTVLEAAPEFGEVGAGVTLAPNAMRGMDFIGVMETVAQAGVEPHRQRIQHWQDDRSLFTMERANARAQYGAPYVYIHRADLHAILVAAARDAGVALRPGAAVVESHGATAILASGDRIEADLLIGADGVKSVVRKKFEAKPPHFTGHVAWRATVNVTAALRELTDYPGIHIGPGRMITRYPVRGGTVLNLVFFARQSGWEEDGWAIASAPGDLSATYNGWSSDCMAMIAAAEAVPHFKWAINARTPLDRWVLDDCVTLLGDAAHGMTPFLGQGAACAIEDAVVLARALAASDSIAAGLSRYVAARHERTSFIQRESNANADRMQGDDTDMFGLTKLRNEETLGLFAYDCCATPV